jgi:hypothetical protein
MRVLLLLYGNEKEWDAAVGRRQADASRFAALERRLEAEGKLVAASALERVRTARTVRVRDGERLVTDGPFAETKEALGGFYLLDVDDLAEAERIAAELPVAETGSVEIRKLGSMA